jgi:hypothetical protein
MSDWCPPAELPDLRRVDIISLDTETRDDRLRADMGSNFWRTTACTITAYFFYRRAVTSPIANKNLDMQNNPDWTVRWESS